MSQSWIAAYRLATELGKFKGANPPTPTPPHNGELAHCSENVIEDFTA